MPVVSLAEMDAVITWVDGADPAHRAKRTSATNSAPGRLHENAVNPHRWGCADELGFCLRALANHAPWLRRIWIVTDAQTPDLSGLPAHQRDRIAVVDHRALFRGHETCLPTFNSLAIESVLWRIPGLAEQFIYFNDDVFLTAPLSPTDVFVDGAPVLRGRWADFSSVAADPASRSDAAKFHPHVQINAARLAGFEPGHMWASAHVVHPMRRSTMAWLFETHNAAFLANLSHAFRDITQFLPMGLYNHTCIRLQRYAVAPLPDHLHLSSNATTESPLDDLRATLRRASLPQSKFLCINDLPRLEQAIPDARDWIERAIRAA